MKLFRLDKRHRACKLHGFTHGFKVGRLENISVKFEERLQGMLGSGGANSGPFIQYKRWSYTRNASNNMYYLRESPELTSLVFEYNEHIK